MSNDRLIWTQCHDGRLWAGGTVYVARTSEETKYRVTKIFGLAFNHYKSEYMNSDIKDWEVLGTHLLAGFARRECTKHHTIESEDTSEVAA